MNMCYTVNMGGYDELKPPKVISKGWDYVVFSDKFIECPPWTCVVTDKHNREVKIKAEELFRGLTLYVDASIRIIGDLNQFCSEVPNWYSVWKHPHRNSVTQEAKAVVKLKGCSPYMVKKQLDKYKGFPDDMGLAACGVLLRDLSDPYVRKINSLWYEDYLNGCGRDQLGFMQQFWRLGLKPDMFGNDIFNKYFYWGSHL